MWGDWGIAGGCTDDWFITQNISYSYTFELPGQDEQGEYGFKLLPRNIKRVRKYFQNGKILCKKKYIFGYGNRT